MHGDFSAKLHKITMLFILQSFHRQQPANFGQFFLENWEDLSICKVNIITHQGQENRTVCSLFLSRDETEEIYFLGGLCLAGSDHFDQHIDIAAFDG